MKYFLAIAIVCWIAFSPGARTQFVLDDYYTVARNSLIKQPALYPKIFTSHLFDSYKSSAHIRFPYYRPILECSYIIDYRLYKLNATGYQWTNWLIHLLNAWLVFILINMLFKNSTLAFLTASLFVVLPTQEWVVRYITGRGDSLQALFGLIALVVLVKSLETKKLFGYLIVLLAAALSVLTRESGFLIPFYGILVAYTYLKKDQRVLNFCFWWIVIGCAFVISIVSYLSFITTWHLLAKQGPILSIHLLYFISIGVCLCGSYLLLKLSLGRFIGFLLVITLALISLSQRQYWDNEEGLLRHTHSLEARPYTVCHQQILMKYDEDPKAIKDFLNFKPRPAVVKSLWLWRLGKIAFDHKDLKSALWYFDQSYKYNSSNIDSLNGKAVALLQLGADQDGIAFLQEAYKKDPTYNQTLLNLGVYYQVHNEPLKSQEYFKKARYYEGQ
ncbi:MAG: hypothetical protein WCH62_05575 [Candidatus Omnitrophota bacterium]